MRENTITKTNLALSTAALVGVLAMGAAVQEAHAWDTDNWSLNALHAPGASLKTRERKGAVTIYDGMMVAEVERAMDQQFNRIGSMMFVRTRYPVAGEIIQDDDCD